MTEMFGSLPEVDMDSIERGFDMLAKAEELRADVVANPVDTEKVHICSMGFAVFANTDALRALANTVREFRADRLVAKAKRLSGLE